MHETPLTSDKSRLLDTVQHTNTEEFEIFHASYNIVLLLTRNRFKHGARNRQQNLFRKV